LRTSRRVKIVFNFIVALVLKFVSVAQSDKALASAPVVLDETYTTPVETHNPMEMHGTVAVWDGDNVTLYECSQGVVNHRIVMAEVLGIPRENVRVISRFIGSGFGGKLFPWPQSTMAAAAARKLNRPVKISVDRRMMFSNTGHRPRTRRGARSGPLGEGEQDPWARIEPVALGELRTRFGVAPGGHERLRVVCMHGAYGDEHRNRAPVLRDRDS
jgi:hypothetical protein